MLTNCFTCQQLVSEKARFCGKCATQIRCKSCGEDLSQGDVVCEMCGEEVIKRQEQSAIPMNRVKFRDGKKDIEIDASFTNEVGDSAATMFAMMRGVQAPPRMPTRSSKGNLSQGEIFASAEVVPDSSNNGLLAADAPAQPIPVRSANPLHSLFELRDEQWVLVNPILKAKSKADYVKRATCLFLQFQFENNIKMVPRGEVIKMLENCSVFDTNARDWFTKEKSLLRATPSDLSLLLPGHQYVADVLQDVFDDSIVNAWKVGTVRKSTKKASKKDDGSSAEGGAEKARRKTTKK